jgi:hypothetical protein
LSVDETPSDYRIEDESAISLVRKTKPLSHPIIVQSLTGIIIKFNVESYHTIKDLKLMVHCLAHISSCQQRIIYKGRQPEDGRSINDCDISENGVVHLILRLAES